MSSESRKNLVCKLIKVMQETETIKKSGRNNHLGFDYSLESDIVEGIRKSLIKNNLFVFTSVEEVTKVDQLTTCKLKCTFVDGDTGEEYTVFSFGQGQDSRDFGLGKSVTTGFKMLFTKNFLLKGEMMDVENDGETPIKQPQKQESKPVIQKPELNKPASGFASKPEPPKAEEKPKEEPKKQFMQKPAATTTTSSFKGGFASPSADKTTNFTKPKEEVKNPVPVDEETPFNA